MEKSIEKVNELKENVNGLVKDAGDSFIDMSSNMGVIDDYKERLDTLLEKANLTPSEQAELVTIGDYFKEKYPEFDFILENEEDIKYTKDLNKAISYELKGIISLSINGTKDLFIINKYNQYWY